MKQLTYKEYEERRKKQNLKQRDYYYRKQKIKIEKAIEMAEIVFQKLKGGNCKNDVQQ